MEEITSLLPIASILPLPTQFLLVKNFQQENRNSRTTRTRTTRLLARNDKSIMRRWKEERSIKTKVLSTCNNDEQTLSQLP
ncbi:hypothetical protein KQX54_010957 [Cotesia glomerata]|uniref:Uncharacterized protein n=1 Tax=Cotesia glomerata TaxID=32391 RepID=A0AAV7J375_COTGL|nr:hypothetical protein KQX54_010957 [Cotesia glomerata]